MKNSAYENFSEKALEALDFARCQRPNGTFYGTSGICKSGSPVGAKEKEAPKGKSSGGEASKAAAGGAPTAKEVRALDKAAKAADKKADAADKKFQKSKSPEDRKEARRLDKEAKAANKAADKADKGFQKGSKAKPAASAEDKAAKEAKSAERAAKQLKSAKARLQMEAKGLKEMRDAGITDSRISAAAARVRNEKAKVEKLRNAAAKKSGKARPEKSTMTSRIAKEERDIRRKAGAGSAKSQQYLDLKRRIQEGRVEDPISARRQLSSLRAGLKPASPNQ